MQPKNLVSGFLKFTLIAVVAAFTGLLSYSFWQWTFPPEQWYYAILGFGLTGGAAIVYLIELVWGNETSGLRKTIALVMMVASMIGELVTAGFGIKLEILTRVAATPTQEDFQFMTISVQLLILLHFAALVAYFAGDTIIEMFEIGTGRDINRDGVIGKKNKGSNNAARMTQNATQRDSARVSGENRPQYTLDQFLAQINLTPDQARFIAAQSQDHNDAFQKLVINRGMSDNTDISGKNFRKLYYGEINPTQATPVNRNGSR